MKILHVINNLSSGGAENLLKEIVPKQKKVNDVDILILTNKNNVFELELIKKGVKIINTNISNNIYNPIQILEIRKYISKYDLIHVHLFPSFYWVAIANMLLFKDKKKLIFTEHNTSNNRRNKSIFRLIEKSIYSKYSKIICISKETKDELKHWLEITEDTEDIKVVNNGIDLNKFKISIAYNRDKIFDKYKSKDVLLLMIARFNEQKDHETVIKAISELPERYKLILVGEGNRIEIIKELVNNLNLRERVVFLGFRSDIPNIIKTCDINILSSHYEGFGLVAVESMASGIPTIVSNVDGLKDVVGNGGILFTKGDHIELKEKILNIYENKENYNRIRESGIKRSELYNIDNMIKSLNNIYNEVVLK